MSIVAVAEAHNIDVEADEHTAHDAAVAALERLLRDPRSAT
jgi:hypothetical protein